MRNQTGLVRRGAMYHIRIKVTDAISATDALKKFTFG